MDIPLQLLLCLRNRCFSDYVFELVFFTITGAEICFEIGLQELETMKGMHEGVRSDQRYLGVVFCKNQNVFSRSRDIAKTKSNGYCIH